MHLTATPVLVPMAMPLVTSGGAIAKAPLILIDLETHSGIVGRAYIMTYTPRTLAPITKLIEEIGTLLADHDPAPRAIRATINAHFRLMGTEGMVLMAAAGIDMAAWDALGKEAGKPLCTLLGGTRRSVKAYNSKGLGIIGPEKAGPEAAALVAEGGFSAIKVRLGYPTIAEDVAVVRAVRAAIDPSITLFCDYNQSLTVPEAEVRVRALAGEGLSWIEEPTIFDDYAGFARIRAASATPIMIGENDWGPVDMARALDAGACDLYMPDAMKIGGVTGWIDAIGLATARRMPISSHLYPEVSAHLLAATPTAQWLEYVDWAAPVLRDPVEVVNGAVLIPDRPGIGMEWDDEAVSRYRV